MSNFAAYMCNRRQSIHTIKRPVGLMILIIGSLFGSCQRDNRPVGVLSPPELSKLMVEIYLAEARAAGNGLPRDSAAKYFAPQEQKIFAKAGVSESTIRVTYQYYIDHPQKFEKIYDAVIDSLNLREQKEKTRISAN